ncbi:GNAT family N-acetyltransferase [Fulvimarina endophytica]|uniref:L-ornithine N(alpha)-acyltransferase n=1 Tax=Fulvimarina endophytica TaxID=2293836 RepID=A0A371X242_9HYPH|nr:GNAT family N-acyltransferase [Fulvimarina endophytica]RFC63104.1 GNAT family N-acetyltransferase [Fulvimarina endophytica]
MFAIADTARGALVERTGFVPSRDGAGFLSRGVTGKIIHLATRFSQDAPVLGRIGSLEVRLARSPLEVKAAQQLRYHVFYEEMSAKPSRVQQFTRRDSDGFDRYCDHLLVIDRDREGSVADKIVGTYRLMRESGARLVGGFYTEQEFNISPMLRRHAGRRFLELGRSCVLKEYRGKRTVELLWQGIWSYVIAHRIDVMFGCASIAGTDPDRIANSLAFLRDAAPAPDEWHVKAHDHCGTFAQKSAEAVDAKRALAALPPLLKGYLRLGGYIGEGAVIDHQFGTTDVMIVLPRERINPRYVNHYGSDAGRFAA